MFIPSTFKRHVLSWKALNLRKTLLMASSVRLKPLNFFNDPAASEIYTLSLLVALPIFGSSKTRETQDASPIRLPPRALTWYMARSAASRSSGAVRRSEEHTSELQSRPHLVCRLLLETTKQIQHQDIFCFC